MMITCKKFLKRLNAYIDQEIDPAEMHIFDRHGETCSECHKILEQLCALAPALQMESMPPVADGLYFRIMAASRNTNFSDVSGWNPLDWWHNSSYPVRATASVFLFASLASGFIIGQKVPVPGEKSTPQSVQLYEETSEIYKFDQFGSIPRGSIADSYLTLASETDWEAR